MTTEDGVCVLEQTVLTETSPTRNEPTAERPWTSQITTMDLSLFI